MKQENGKVRYGIDNPHPLSQLTTELVWEGKYDEYGNRRDLSKYIRKRELIFNDPEFEPMDHAGYPVSVFRLPRGYVRFRVGPRVCFVQQESGVKAILGSCVGDSRT
jgi:hypothetical protein